MIDIYQTFEKRSTSPLTLTLSYFSLSLSLSSFVSFSLKPVTFIMCVFELCSWPHLPRDPSHKIVRRAAYSLGKIKNIISALITRTQSMLFRNNPALNMCSHLCVLYHKLSFAILNSHQLHRAALFTGERDDMQRGSKTLLSVKIIIKKLVISKNKYSKCMHMCVYLSMYIYKYMHMYTHITLQKENRFIVSSPSYLWEVCPKTPRGCLKLQIQLNPIYAMLSPTSILFT